MEILRVSPFADIVKTFTIPAGYTTVDVYVTTTDLADMTANTLSYLNVSSGFDIDITLPGTYDNSYRVEITTTGEGSSITYLSDETYNLVRPYANPADLATTGTATEIAEYTVLEMVARSLIDTHVEFGFYNKKTIIQTTGQGGDYIPVWGGVSKVLKVYENNVLAYDVDAEDPTQNLAVYTMTADKTAIQRVEADAYNRTEGQLKVLYASGGDIWDFYGRLVAFPNGYDYTFVVENGYGTLPADVEYAAKLLIDDLKCGKLEYYKRYTTNYSTDQFKIQFDKSIIEGTGNLIVDKILEKYNTPIKRLGII